MGTDSGTLFLVDHKDGTGNPSNLYRYTVGLGAVSSLSYNANRSSFMVGTADGRLVLIPAPTDPTPSSN